jgi:uncharacterized protein (DUF1800 family)
MATLYRPTGAVDPETALRPWTGSWNARSAAHLMRRAGFGAAPEELQALSAQSMEQSVDALLHPQAAPANPPQAVSLETLLAEGPLRALDEGARRERLRAFRKEEVQSIADLQEWWLNRMLTSPAPLQEKMTLLLHGHFTTAAVQKRVTPDLVLAQNELFRRYAFGNLRDLTLDVSRDPAMLLYLDNWLSSKEHPNENYARELMELYTLGRGNYTEEDVRQSARAFTGWTIDRRTQQFMVNVQMHDDGIKQFLGQSGNFDGTDVVRIIFRQPACARFWAAALLNWFVYNDPEPQLVDAVARVVVEHDFTLAPVLSVLLRSNVFYSERAYRALVKSPVEFVVGTYKLFGSTAIERPALRALAQMGQILFHPPNVAGWPGGAAWLSSQTLLARENFLAQLTRSQAIAASSWLMRLPRDPLRAADTLVETILQADAPAQSYDQLASYLRGDGEAALGMLSAENYEIRVRGAAYLAASMPAYQLN